MLNFFLTADFALFHHGDHRHQADTADRGGVQRGERARPAGQTKNGGAVGNHAQTQLGKAIADKISEGALDTVRSADGFFGTKPTAATPINSCGPNTGETEREQRGQIDILVAGVLVDAEGGDD